MIQTQGYRMERVINKRENLILYLLQNVMGYIVHYFIVTIRLLLPTKYRNQLSKIEKNDTFVNIIGLTVFNAIGGLLLMFTNVKIANVLGAEIFGTYSYYLAIGEVGSNVVRYGRNKTMTRDLIQKPTIFDSLISNTLVLGVINLLAILIVVFLFRNPLEVEISFTTLLLVIAPCIGSLDFICVYESLREMSWHSIYYLIQRLFFLIAVWCGIFFSNKLSMQYLGVMLFMSWLIIFLMQYREVICGFCIRVWKEVSWSNIWNLYKTNFVIALSCLTGVAFGPIIRLILNQYADSSVVGVYSAGMQIFLISQFLMHQVSRVGNPMMAEAGKEDVSPTKRKNLCSKYCMIMFIAVAPFAIPLILLPHFITELFFTDEYFELGYYLPIFAIYLLSLSFGIVYTQFLISMRKDKIYFIIYIGSALATMLASIILIPHYSLLGAIIALCIPHSVGCLFYYLCSIKYLKS